jgi:hypothetical protein
MLELLETFAQTFLLQFFLGALVQQRHELFIELFYLSFPTEPISLLSASSVSLLWTTN